MKIALLLAALAASASDLRLSEIQMYASSLHKNSILAGKGIYRTDFVITEEGVEFTELTSRRGSPRGGHKNRPHDGIDIAAPLGADLIYTGFNGESAYANVGYENGGCGNYVFLKRSDGTDTLFCHFSTVDVSDGEFVEPGAKLGEIGDTGNASGPHLHYEKHKNGKSVRLEKMK